ncbi:uncharacterized protein HMPREF1120_02918 [Exophiala dermatitidis NIH/UT8656]|uniref:Uncharacterized protein n=1 Tax=Exophiala dermatitidis (strain ATCC 34100 / CBS 525.76 / NIH/UT8656) TaxID=858893 RepID=H6BRM4_EXODN|nr:uncharacterized protein HMPREF1120_02918 [Exophiala dermatitidis NIH/UT8656]EHY54753.1 hypothetical protein HMPREF1120_02918 [Exophiala dermatitidis NIH/UT8656]
MSPAVIPSALRPCWAYGPSRASRRVRSRSALCATCKGINPLPRAALRACRIPVEPLVMVKKASRDCSVICGISRARPSAWWLRARRASLVISRCGAKVWVKLPVSALRYCRSIESFLRRQLHGHFERTPGSPQSSVRIYPRL